jgi:hypothetical protein
MKTRTGFVSNSSSSSFIIALPNKPESLEEIRDWLFFKNALWYSSPHSNEEWPREQVAERVFNDLKKCKSLTKEKMIDELCGGWFKTMFDIEHFEEGEDRKVNWDKWDAYKRTEAKFVVDEWVKAHKKMKFFVLSYSDGDGSFECALEHGTLLERIPHIVICHH